jgi:ribosomal protein S18 acetylase RimI-like enzyme
MIAGLRLERIVRPPPRDVFYLAHLGVTPGQRGAGFGTQLIEHLLALGRASGFARAGLDVATTNPRAQALYERMGFVVGIIQSMTSASRIR